MKVKIKFENIFVVVSLLFIFACFCFYGYRLVKYYRVFNPKTESGEKTEIFSATVRQDNAVVTEGDGLYIHNGDFFFKGEDVNNYVKYADKLWRIMQISRSGEVKMILEEPLTSTKYDTNESDYKDSEIHAYISNNDLKIKSSDLVKNTICLDKIDDANETTCKDTMEADFTLPSIDDYLNSVNASTSKSYINSDNTVWLYNQTNEQLSWTIEQGLVKAQDSDYEYDVKLVITLNSTAYSDTGEGTLDKPYVVKVGE